MSPYAIEDMATTDVVIVVPLVTMPNLFKSLIMFLLWVICENIGYFQGGELEMRLLLSSPEFPQSNLLNFIMLVAKTLREEAILEFLDC